MKIVGGQNSVEQKYSASYVPIRLCAALVAVATLLFSPLQPAIAAMTDCSDTQSALQYWRPIKEGAATTAIPADDLSLELISCLGSPNPELRDRIAYELFTYWLRNSALSDETRLIILAKLSERMSDSRIETSLSRSFSALILAELMRADMQSPLMSETQRGSLLENTIEALRNERDYRGLDDEIGWVHPIAHMSDLLWRFALHPETNAAQAHLILSGVKSQVAPNATSYRFNESDRLARVVSALIRRGSVSDDDTESWLKQFATPKSMERWSDAFQSSAGMAELHNTKQFLRSLSDQLEPIDVGLKTSKKLAELVQGFTQLI